MDASKWSDSQALAYIASYADLRLAFGANPAAGRAHYAQAGAFEGRSISFDPLAYTASYADLRAAIGTDAAAGARHFIVAGASERRSISFDALAYTASYADLRSAFGTDTAAAARHYIAAGAAEGRSAAFDAMSYTASYADLISAFGTDTAAATRHFIVAGASEGRSASFDALAYIASYADLRAAFGTNAAAATQHFVAAGASEGRSILFDALAYTASYADLRAAFATDAAAASRHFIAAGASEGRSVSFDAVNYLFSQPDLLAAGLTAAQAVRHWIIAGANESRNASIAFGTDQSSHAHWLSSTVAGTIDRAGDRDWFQVNLAAGRGISFDFLPSNGNGVVSVHDAAGRLLAPSEVVGARTSFLAPASGLYYVVVSTANLATGTYTLNPVQVFTRTGTGGADTLGGTGGADLIRGLEGSDVLNGGGGNDVLEGGTGYDQLNGGLGDDILYGNNATDWGFDGADTLSDDQGGNDQLFGQEGHDSLYVSRYAVNGNMAASAVLLDGGNGDDTLTFSSSRFVDTVTLRGGGGNDTINVGSVSRSYIDAGDGNDKVRIGMLGGNQTITLGAGSDVLSLDDFSYGFSIGNPTLVVDFQIGSDTLDIDAYLANVLYGWDKVANPFTTGHLRLAQSGSETLLQLDRDGSAGGGYGLATLLTFGNTNAAAFTARELGYAPDGSAPAGQTMTGTGGPDTLNGTNGNDIIRGLEGGDTLNGRGGNDLLEGGIGYDQLNGGLGDDILYGNNATNWGSDAADYLIDDQGGNDQLFGQDGDDSLSVSRYATTGTIAASTVLLDGGAGNDSLNFSAGGRFLDTVTVRGGAGGDTISVGSVLRSVIDAGDGNDKVTIGMSGGDQAITLGAGSDLLMLDSNPYAVAIGNPTRVVDFQIGSDTLDIDKFLANVLSGWDRATNPFGTGHLRLVQSGSDTLLQLDRDGSTGSGYALATLLTFGTANAAAFTARDIGFTPDGSVASGQTITGTAALDSLYGTDGADLIRGLESGDTLNGRGGNDVLEGGEGSDQLNGGLGDDILYGNSAANWGFDASDYLTDDQGGNDQLLGQEGDDYLTVSRQTTSAEMAASVVLLDGGSGNDSINFYAGGRFLDTVTVRGGAGNDTINIGSVLRSVIDAGDGDDKVSIGMTGGDQTITLGTGSDVLTLNGNPYPFAIGNPTRVVDFQIGTDTLSIDSYLTNVLSGWDRITNPFATGHLRLAQSGSDTLLQLDRDGSAGGGYGLATLLTLSNTNAAAFTAKDLGHAPVFVTGTAQDAIIFDLLDAAPDAPLANVYVQF